MRMKPSRCMSRGRAPMRHPPGVNSLTSPLSARSAPSMNTEERIAQARWGGISVREGDPLTMISRPRLSMSAPRARSTHTMSSTSVMKGQFRTVTGSGVSRLAASMGSTAFFAPLISVLPKRGRPPLILRISLFILSSPKAESGSLSSPPRRQRTAWATSISATRRATLPPPRSNTPASSRPR